MILVRAIIINIPGAETPCAPITNFAHNGIAIDPKTPQYARTITHHIAHR